MKHELWNSSIELNGDVTASTWLRRQLIGFHGDEGEDIGWLFNKDLLMSISGTSAIKGSVMSNVKPICSTTSMKNDIHWRLVAMGLMLRIDA